mmetsp:Transcript_17043/g.35573  ORF Transcript_17043/g.35573 Transcript_17043/m.35573 type:complete len:1400 (+) Transcript_17043:267-4466(+)|eukprot:CAMPEP_0171355328 /NCGR_PEP_ID=MMETSP0878-20121228/45162_1 /TAXON_ID=67004 /ORGANISM="Thalassiosira weissflogii, Strain CCMP1336" /LENGTH=1399 /DNA_ID=CAMNT_0011861327 /DNA_START=217 /DNA_END=4416 /DNA_ORIENTATION=-
MYGSTNATVNATDREDVEDLVQIPGQQYLSWFPVPAPNRQSSLPRNESSGAKTTATNETEPLLGERLLMPNDDEVAEEIIKPDAYFDAPDKKIPRGARNNGGQDPHFSVESKDASTINEDGSDHDLDEIAPIPTCKNHFRNFSVKSSQSESSFPDPHIGTNVITNELDTLVYSRDPDESTLLTTDNFGGNKIQFSSREDSESEDYKRRTYLGCFGRILGIDSLSSEGDFPYYLICFGLAVGIGLCAVAAFGYVEYSKRRGVNILPGSSPNVTKNNEATNNGGSIAQNSAETTTVGSGWHGVPFLKIGRDSYGDPVSNIFDESLFHPSLLYQGDKNDTGRSETTIAELGQRKHMSTSNVPLTQKPFLNVAFPTGAFWTNLVVNHQSQQQRLKDQFEPLQHKSDNKGQYSYPIVAYPYAFQWSDLGRLQASYSATRRTVKPNSIQDAFLPDITIGAVEDIQSRHIMRFDSLSVTLRFYSGNSVDENHGSDTDDDSSFDGHGHWDTYIVQGSPYITSKYHDLHPELTALSDFDDIQCPPTMMEQISQSSNSTTSNGHLRRNLQEPIKHRRDLLFTDLKSESSVALTNVAISKKLGICEVSPDSTQHKKYITGVQFVVTTKEGLTWLVFTSEPITFQFDQAAKRSLQSKGLFGGIIRLALVPPSSISPGSPPTSGSNEVKPYDMEQLASSPGVKRLIYHAGAYPIGATVSWDFRSGIRVPLSSVLSDPNKGHRKTQQKIEDTRVNGILANPARKHQQSEQAKRRTAYTTAKENNIGRVTFHFDTMHMTSSSPSSKVPLLMLSLPHHSASMSSADDMLIRSNEFELVYRSIKGIMVPIVGSTWSYEEDLTFTGFGDEVLSISPSLTNNAANVNGASGGSSTTTTKTSGRHPIISEYTAISVLDWSVRNLLLETIESDLKVNLPVLSSGAYAFGKGLARLAQLAHIADVTERANGQESGNAHDLNLGNKTSSASAVSGKSTSKRAYTLLEKYLTLWLLGDGGDGLLYDANLGGIVSKQGMEDIYADFGNGRYNDHHFHYGYVLYAAAVLGRANPDFVAQYSSYIDAIYYDVAHNSTTVTHNDEEEIFFPLARHKSWFDGHSFASGLFEFANGKSQESSSEAVNCYYGAYLWAKVRWGGGGESVDFARLLLASEITGAKTYWHMIPQDDKNSAESGFANSGSTNLTNIQNKIVSKEIGAENWKPPVAYDSIFQKNYMVGNLGMTDATCTTWFGTENVYVHLINLMPVTAITAELFNKGYVNEERKTLNKDESVDYAWRGYLICNEAIVDPNNAWTAAQGLISSQLDAGLSKSQALYWIVTREGFLSSTTSLTSKESTESGGIKNNELEEIKENSWSSFENKTQSSDLPDNAPSGSSSKCEDNERCSAALLNGMCCPTTDGIYLSCC